MSPCLLTRAPPQSTLREPLEEAEFRLPLRAADFKAAGGVVVDGFAAGVRGGAFGPAWSGAAVNHEGFRACVAEGGDKAGWALLRQSLHDPLLVLNVESDVAGGGAAIAHECLCWLQKHGGDDVDVSALEAAFAPGAPWTRFGPRTCSS